MNDLSKLPKWAQTEITRLRSDVDYWKAQARSEIKETNTYQEVGLRAEDVPLPKNARIRFQLGERYDEYVSISIDRNGNTLHVMAGGSISILPQVTNVIDIKVIER